MSGSNSFAWNFLPPLGPVGPLGGQPQPPTCGTFAGMTIAQLQAALTSAQTALTTLITGGQPVTVTYNVGEGSRSVTYQRTSEAALRGLIAELLAALNLGRRRAITPVFR